MFKKSFYLLFISILMAFSLSSCGGLQLTDTINDNLLRKYELKLPFKDIISGDPFDGSILTIAKMPDDLTFNKMTIELEEAGYKAENVNDEYIIVSVLTEDDTYAKAFYICHGDEYNPSLAIVHCLVDYSDKCDFAFPTYFVETYNYDFDTGIRENYVSCSFEELIDFYNDSLSKPIEINYDESYIIIPATSSKMLGYFDLKAKVTYSDGSVTIYRTE